MNDTRASQPESRPSDSSDGVHVAGAVHPRSWVEPEVTDLPRLTDLTLQTGAPIDGGETVFP